MHRLRRNHHSLAASEHGGRLGVLRIAGAQIARLEHELAGQQILGVLGRQPAAIFGDADGYDFIFFFIDCVENRGRREQRNFMLSAAPAK